MNAPQIQIPERYEREIPQVYPMGLSQALHPDAAITFYTNNEKVLEFFTDGRVFVRGELVDNNKEIYAAVIDFLNQEGYYSKNSSEHQPRGGSDKEHGRSRFEILKTPEKSDTNPH